jgi:DNA-binding CsgD family transcriptional regulator
MIEHLQLALQIAKDQGRTAAQCEVLSLLALQASSWGSAQQDDALLAMAERCAREAKSLFELLPGHSLWGAEADAALARALLARGEITEAAIAARSAMSAVEAAKTEDLPLQIMIPAAAVLAKAGTAEEASHARYSMNFMAKLLAQHIADEQTRVQWFRGPIGRELRELAGNDSFETMSQPHRRDTTGLAETETRLLQLLIEGRTNKEIADELQIEEAAVNRQLAETFVKVGASTRAEATSLAMIRRLV